MRVLDLAQLPYRDAWAEQERIHAEILAGAQETIILVEHPPVVTMGRRGETLGVANLTATPDQLAARGVEFVQTDRGGDITFHGPGQLVAYPIIRLADHKLSVGGYVKALQRAAISTLESFGILGTTDSAGIGVWVHLPLPPGERAGVRGRTPESFGGISPLADPTLPPHPNPLPRRGEGTRGARKICAFGVRVKHGVTLHGLALNVTTDLSYFNLIIPCGIADRGVTSMREVLGDECPAMPQVKETLVRHLGALGASAR